MIQSNDYMNEMRNMILEGYPVSIILSGNSMVPFLINQRDVIYVEKADKPIKKGDMCFFQRKDGTFIMHRIFKVEDDQYFFVGDAQPVIEGPITRDQIFGIVTKAKRKGKWITKGDFRWDFFEKIWIRMVPIRIPLLKIYGRLKG